MIARQKENYEVELDRAIELNQNEQSWYIMSVESILHYDRMVDFSQLKEIIGEVACITTKHCGPILPQS